MAHALTLGALNLNGGVTAGCTFDALADGADWGNPDSVTTVIESLLQDGAIVAHLSDGNREAFLKVRITGTNAATLAAGEAALVAEVGRTNELTWTPDDGTAQACVFEVWTSNLEHTFDDLLEKKRHQRIYGLRLVCQPFARAAALTVVPALTSAPTLTTTLVDACSSTTGWTGGTGALFLLSGAVVVEEGGFLSPNVVQFLQRTSTAIDMSASPYLTIRLKTTLVSGTLTRRFYADGVQLAVAALVRVSFTGGQLIEDVTLYCPDTSITTIRVEVSRSTEHYFPSVAVDNINRSNQVPFTGTARQKARTIAIGGSVRTQGSLSIQHATSALGEVLCYVYQDTGTGYRPDLRVRRTAGGTVTADAAQVSGSTEDINTLTTFEIPIATLPPGPYALMARVAKITTTTARTVTWTAQAKFGSTLTGPVITGTARIPTSAAGAWEIHCLGFLDLPTMATPEGSTGVIVLTLDEGGGGLSFDEGWLFDTKRGALIWTDAGTGTLTAGTIHNRLWINSPTITEPRPAVYLGVDATQVDAHYPAVMKSWEIPTFDPGLVNVHTVTTGALDADVALTYYKRFHTHVA